MIRIFFTGLGGGKSSLGTALAIPLMLNPLPLINYENQCENLHKLGLKTHLLKHMVASNYKIKGLIDDTYELDTKKLKITCEKDNINLPFGMSIFIDEAQNVFPSKGNLPKEKSRTMELSRQGDFDIYLFAQRVMEINKTVRDITGEFYHILEFKTITDSLGRIIKCVWTTRLITNNAEIELYLCSSDREKRKFGIIRKFTFDGDIFQFYDTKYYKFLFTNPTKNDYDLGTFPADFNTEEDLLKYIKSNKIKD